MTEKRNNPAQKNDDQIDSLKGDQTNGKAGLVEEAHVEDEEPKQPPDDPTKFKVWGNDRYTLKSIPTRDLGKGPTHRVIYVEENFTDGSALEILSVYGAGMGPHPLEELVLFANKGVKSHAKRQRKLARKMLEDFGDHSQTPDNALTDEELDEAVRQAEARDKLHTSLKSLRPLMMPTQETGKMTKPASPTDQKPKPPEMRVENRGLTPLEYWGPIGAALIMIVVAWLVDWRIGQ